MWGGGAQSISQIFINSQSHHRVSPPHNPSLGMKAICQDFCQGGQIRNLSCADSDVGYTASQSILTSRGGFIGCPEGEAGVHKHKNILLRKQLKTFKMYKISKIYKEVITSLHQFLDTQPSVRRLYNTLAFLRVPISRPCIALSSIGAEFKRYAFMGCS